MSHSDNITGFVFGLGMGGYWFIQGMRLWLRKREILNRPLSNVKSVAMGDAELCGEVEAIKLLKAPYSGADCVYCEYKVEVPNKNGWREVEHGTKSLIFNLNDGSGRILVNPEGAQYFGEITYQQVMTESMLSKRRYTERVVKPGQRIFLEGYVSTIKQVVNGRTEEGCIVSRGGEEAFLLSSYSEEGLLAQLGWKIPLQVVGGGAMLLGCLWYLVIRFQLEQFIR
jgi:hypothetical protein